ncbi:MAG: elongation factor Ts [Hyphomonadaceae bacterium]|nr:elongation factor Ts [Hyphomonadaceae bacterium]
MAQITAALVKELRGRTSAGMMDCKKALTETDSDLEAAVDWLRKKGIAKADKKAGRIAAEGVVALALDGTTGALVEVNSETDFVARNENFQAIVSEIATLGLSANSVDALREAQTSAGVSVGEHLTNLVSTIGENVSLRRCARQTVGTGIVSGYIHNAVADNMGRIGVLVALESDGRADRLDDLGRKIAMHIAAMSPLALHVDDLDADLVAGERNILIEEARESGKPDNIIERMVDGRMKKFFGESTLMTQMFVMDTDRSIEQVIADEARSMGSHINITGYSRLELGEGVEKKEEDFAAEVAAAVTGQ